MDKLEHYRDIIERELTAIVEQRRFVDWPLRSAGQNSI
jgi:hypothetical protein